jgi:hypothetical protein
MAWWFPGMKCPFMTTTVFHIIKIRAHTAVLFCIFFYGGGVETKTLTIDKGHFLLVRIQVFYIPGN